MKSFWSIFRETGQSITMASGITTLIIGVISLGVVIPVFVSVPIIVGIGLLVGAVTAYTVYQEHKRKEREQAEQDFQMQNMQDTSSQIVNTVRRVESNVIEIKNNIQPSVNNVKEAEAKQAEVKQKDLKTAEIKKKEVQFSNPLQQEHKKPSSPVRSFSSPNLKDQVNILSDQVKQVNDATKNKKKSKRSHGKRTAFFSFFRKPFKQVKHKKPVNDSSYAAQPRRAG